MGRETSLALRSCDGRCGDDVPGVHAEVEDVALSTAGEQSMRSLVVVAAIMCGVLFSSGVRGQGTGQKEMGILHVQGNVYMLVGALGNSTVQIGNDGVLVVDTMTTAEANALLAAIRT